MNPKVFKYTKDYVLYPLLGISLFVAAWWAIAMMTFDQSAHAPA